MRPHAKPRGRTVCDDARGCSGRDVASVTLFISSHLDFLYEHEQFYLHVADFCALQALSLRSWIASAWMTRCCWRHFAEQHAEQTNNTLCSHFDLWISIVFRFPHQTWLTLGFADAIACFDLKRWNYTSFISFFVLASRESRLALYVRKLHVLASRYFFKSFSRFVLRLRCVCLLSRNHFTSDRSFSFRGLVQASSLFFRMSNCHVGYACGICASEFRFGFAFCLRATLRRRSMSPCSFWLLFLLRVWWFLWALPAAFTQCLRCELVHGRIERVGLRLRFFAQNPILVSKIFVPASGNAFPLLASIFKALAIKNSIGVPIFGNAYRSHFWLHKIMRWRKFASLHSARMVTTFLECWILSFFFRAAFREFSWIICAINLARLLWTTQPRDKKSL